MPENNQILSVEGQLVGMPLAGPESFSQQQLDYLKRALGVDETVLWENSTHTPPSGDTRLTATIAYNESVGNFEFVDVYYNQAKPSQMGPAVSRRPVVNGGFTFGISWPEKSPQDNWFKMCISGSGTAGSMDGGHSSYSNAYSFENNTYLGGIWGAGIIDKVVGIHRIAGGN